jgi:hypothetical protein
MEDIGTKDGRAATQRVFILSGIPKGMGVSTENSEKPKLLGTSWKRLQFPQGHGI